MVYIIFAIAFLLIAALFGWYTYQLHKKYPKFVKAKVLRIEQVDGKNRYWFSSKSGGGHIMSDESLYKDKPYKTHQRINVHMSECGTKCMSNMSIWPIAVSIAAILLSCTMVLAYFGEIRAEKAAEEAAQTLYQETGRFIVTDSDLLMEGENLGLIRLKDADKTNISTGDYGNVLFFGTPHIEEGETLYDIHALGNSVSEDGTAKDISAAVEAQVIAAGYTIDSSESVYVPPVQEESTEDHDHDHEHDHEEDNATVTENTENNEAEDETVTETITEAGIDTVASEVTLVDGTEPTETDN